MAKVRVTVAERQPWQAAPAREETPTHPEGGPWSGYKIREPGSGGGLQLVELRFAPDEVVDLHCHDEAELIYILGGSMRVNNRKLGPGSTLSIAGSVFYGFTAGPEGLHFLNFRGRADPSFHLPGKRQFVIDGEMQ